MGIQTSIENVVSMLYGTTDGTNQKMVYSVDGMYFSEKYNAIMLINYDSDGNVGEVECLVNITKDCVSFLIEFLKLNADLISRMGDYSGYDPQEDEKETSNC